MTDIRNEWRLADIERAISAKPDSHEIYSLRSDVASLERQLRETRSEIDGLRSELQTMQENLMNHNHD